MPCDISCHRSRRFTAISMSRNYSLITNDMNKFAKAMSMAEGQEVNFADAVLASPEQIKPDMPKTEKRSRKVHTYLKPSEYEAFISYIGRETLSNALRQLVLDFNRKRNAEKTH